MNRKLLFKSYYFSANLLGVLLLIYAGVTIVIGLLGLTFTTNNYNHLQVIGLLLKLPYDTIFLGLLLMVNFRTF